MSYIGPTIVGPDGSHGTLEVMGHEHVTEAMGHKHVIYMRVIGHGT